MAEAPRENAVTATAPAAVCRNVFRVIDLFSMSNSAFAIQPAQTTSTIVRFSVKGIMPCMAASTLGD
jgi:hypothetical protein